MTSPMELPTLEAAVLVRIQNVYDWYSRERREGRDTFNFDNICFNPPFRSMVFSYLDDKMTHFDLKVSEVSADFAKELGVAQETREEAWKSAVRYLCALVCKEGEDPWCQNLFALDRDGHICLPTYHQLREDGAFIHKWKAAHPDNAARAKEIESKHGSIENFLIEAEIYRLQIAMLAVQFMNCRNVQIVDNPPSRQQRRAAELRGEPAPASYKTLVISPFMKRTTAPGAGGNQASPALHIARGHFKDYRQGPGLGKYHVSGIWWWEQSLRGKKERGRVVKDYELADAATQMAPAEAEDPGGKAI
jgi:hypothetical protein